MNRRTQRGVGLVELMVALTIGLGVTLAVSSLLVATENQKRTTTSTNDANQTGVYAFHVLDRALRSAGSGLMASARPPIDAGLLGCRLNAAAVLPRAGAFPAPFEQHFLAGATGNLRIAPMLIAANQSDQPGSDVLVVMGGSGASGGVSRPVNGAGGANSIVLQSTIGLGVGDLVVVSQAGTTDCLLEEVTASATPTLTLGGTYFTPGTTTPLTTLGSNLASYVTPIGNATANDLQFQLFGVGTNTVLYSYDLLQNQRLVQGSGGDTSEAIADGIVRMNAIYGVQSAAAPQTLAAWASPTDAGYDITSVMTNPATMQNIVAVRVALVARGEYYDKHVVTPSTLTLFEGLSNAAGTPLTKTIALTADDQHYRYRIFEFTVPLRNLIL